MKDNKYILNTALAAVLGITLLICVLVRTFQPTALLPKQEIPGMVLLSLVALVADHYLTKGGKRCYVCVFLLSALSFGLLPFAACFVGAMDALKLGILGGVVFTVTTWLFSSMQERLSSGPAAKAAPVVSAFGLYLASQCLMGIFSL